MEKIWFDNSTYIWKTKLNMLNNKENLLKTVYKIEDSNPTSKNIDAYPYDTNIDNKFDEIIDKSLDICKSLYIETGNIYNNFYADAWINIVRSKTPVQPSFVKEHTDVYHLSEGNAKYHTHTEIKKKQKSFFPHYTWVYYIQMPDIMEGDDGALYIKGENDKEYWIRPENDDLIIMEGYLPHAPNNAPKSNIDRIVFAGNVGFEFTKNSKSII
jgi:hypothetical protein